MGGTRPAISRHPASTSCSWICSPPPIPPPTSPLLRSVTVTPAQAPAAQIHASSAQPTQVTARISIPADGSLVRGSVPIVGEAAGPDFDHYIVEYSTAAQPDTWIELASGSRAVQPSGPISIPQGHTLFGNLATLDAGLSNYRYDFDPNLKRRAALDGLVTLRLRVFSRHGQVAEARSRVVVGRVVPYVSDSVVDSADGQAVLHVPSLAIHSDAQLFSLEQVNPPTAPSGFALAGSAYTLFPAGYTFATSPTLQMAVPAGTRNAQIYAWNAASQYWQPLVTRRSGGSLLAQTGQDQSAYAVLVPRGTLPAPVLFAPSGTSGGMVLLAGTATAGASVRLLDNGQPFGTVVRSDGDGLFHVTLPLPAGSEQIVQAVATDSTGRSSLASSPLSIHPIVQHLSVTSLQARSADFTGPAPSTLDQGCPGGSGGQGRVRHACG